MDEKTLHLLDEKMEEWLRIGHDRNSGNARYGVVWANGELEDLDYTYCHGSLAGLGGDDEYYDADEERYVAKPREGHCIAVVNQIQMPRVEEHEALRYYEWLFNFSPFRSAFPEKDYKKVYDRHVFVTDTSVAANLMVGGLMASRFPTENYDGNGLYRLCTLWNRLVERDVHPNLAYSVASIMRVGNECDTLAVVNNAGGHQAIAPREFTGTHKNFLNDSPAYLSSPYMEVHDYDNINATWGKCVNYCTGDSDSLNLSIIDLFSNFSMAEKGLNPFGKAIRRNDIDNDYRGTASSVVDYNAMLNPLAQHLNEYTPLLMAA